ncbi:MAG TPA: cytochrome c3 family protein [Polyangia bacterium]|nr:cytochrome c3 family protein [Polyangia bacterium]
MKTVFPEWTDNAYRVVLAVLALAGAALVVGPMVYVRTPYHQRREFPVEQPVQFDHRHHVRDDSIDCLYCHSGATHTAWAGVPATELCMGCHAQVWPDSIQLEPVRRSYFSGRPIEWSRVHALPDYVYFNHAIHVNKGVGCATCHGRVDQMAAVYQVATLQMDWCLDCHRDPAPRLRPREAITSMEWQPPAGEAGERLARELAAEYGVRKLTNCTTCHR